MVHQVHRQLQQQLDCQHGIQSLPVAAALRTSQLNYELLVKADAEFHKLNTHMQ